VIASDARSNGPHLIPSWPRCNVWDLDGQHIQSMLEVGGTDRKRRL
jgi:hypothetical protein